VALAQEETQVVQEETQVVPGETQVVPGETQVVPGEGIAQCQSRRDNFYIGRRKQ